MKVVHVSTYGGNRGAARGAYRVHTALESAGIDSAVFVQSNEGGSPGTTEFEPPADVFGRGLIFLRRKQIRLAFRLYRSSRPAGSEYFSDDRSECGRLPWDQIPETDILNLHWVAGFVDYRSFLVKASKHTRLVWRLSDMNPFTGGCHYDNGCGKYMTGCGRCPQLGSKNRRDLSKAIWNRKSSVFSKIPSNRLHFVATNPWMAEKVRTSTLLKRFPVTIVRGGLNTEDFSPSDSDYARTVLGLPKSGKVVLFVADSVDNNRKGLHLLTKALNGLLDLPDLYLASVGKGTPLIESRIPHLHLGRTDNDRLMSLLYSAADVFVIPSLEDNSPNTVLEAMACATPVAGFNVGGVPDMVKHGVTGLLAPVGDVESLRSAIVELLQNDEKRLQMGMNCRRIVLERHSLEVVAHNYVQLYNQILGQDS